MDSPGAPSSSRLSPFKTYREFVADQRDDADPQAFARRYGEYRGGFARELVRRFFERNADFAWFRDRYDPSRVEERCEKQRARAAGAAKRFREDVDKAGEDAVKQASLDPNAIETVAPTDEDEDKVPLEASLHAVPDHAAANCVLLPGAPPVCGEAALRDAVKRAVEKDDDEKKAPPRLLIDDAAARRKDGFEVDCWLLFADKDQARDACKLLQDARLDVPVPPALTDAPLPWDEASIRNARNVTDDDDLGEDHPDPIARDTAEERVKRGLDREPTDRDNFRCRARRALLAASTPAVDDLGRSKPPRRAPRPWTRGGAALATRPRLARDAAQAQALAEALDAAADVPEEDRFARVVEGDGELAELLRGDNAARLDVCAAYLRRVHLHLYYGGARCRDEVDLLTRDAAWLTRPDAADEPLNAAEELALFEKESTKLRDRLSETRKRRRSDGDEAADEAKDEEPKDEEKEEEEDWGASLRAEDEKTIRLIQQATREADATAEPDASAGVGPGRCYHPRGRCAKLFPREGRCLAAARARFDGLHKLEEDNGRARCAFEWCRKLFKSDEYLKKHLANRHGDHLEAYLTSARRPFMWAVYDADAHKPLPPLRTANGDEVEPLDLLRGGDFQAPRKRDRRDRDRGRDRDRRDRGRRDDFRSPRERYAAGPPRPPPGAERSSDTRKPPSYDDVDAPKRPVLDLDYGVLLPPPAKKKKKSAG